MEFEISVPGCHNSLPFLLSNLNRTGIRDLPGFRQGWVDIWRFHCSIDCLRELIESWIQPHSPSYAGGHSDPKRIAFCSHFHIRARWTHDVAFDLIVIHHCLGRSKIRSQNTDHRRTTRLSKSEEVSSLHCVTQLRNMFQGTFYEKTFPNIPFKELQKVYDEVRCGIPNTFFDSGRHRSLDFMSVVTACCSPLRLSSTSSFWVLVPPQGLLVRWFHHRAYQWRLC